MSVASVFSVALVLVACLRTNAYEVSQAGLTDSQLNMIQGQLNALHDLIHAQALRITQLEAQLVDFNAQRRRLEGKDEAGNKNSGAPLDSSGLKDRKGVSIKSDKAWLTMGAKSDFKIVYTGSESATIYKNVKVAGELQAGTIKVDKAQIAGELQTDAINVKSAKIAGELQADSITVGGKSLTSYVISLRDKVLGADGKILKAAKSCKAHLQAGNKNSGLYPVGTSEKYHMAYCDMKTNGGGWELVLNRVQKVGDKTTDKPVTPDTPSKALSDSNWASLQGTFTEVMAFDPSDKQFTTTTVAKLSSLGACQKPLPWPPTSLTRSPIAQYERSNCHGSGSDHAHWFGIAIYPGFGIAQYTEKDSSKFGYAPDQNTRVTDYDGHFGITWKKGATSIKQLFMLVR